MSDDNSNLHHLIPKLKGGAKGETVRLHLICHGKIHSLWSENQLRDYYNTIDKIMSDDRMQKFANWVSKKDPDFNDSSKMTKTHKRKNKK